MAARPPPSLRRPAAPLPALLLALSARCLGAAALQNGGGGGGQRGLDATALVQRQRGGAKGREAVYHLHIPRTAGTSFNADAGNIINEDIVSKEGCYDWRYDFPGVTRVAMMVRSPREHVLSQYLYCSEGHISFMTQVPRPNKFKEWVTAWADLQASGHVAGDYARDAGSVEREERYQTLITSTSLPYKCYNPIDLQSQHLTCVRPFLFPKEVDAELAITNMQEAWFVGLTEAYQESLCLLHVKARGVLPAYCNCKNATAWQSFHTSHTSYHSAYTWTSRNVTAQPKEVIQAVDNLTRTDRLVYKAAVQRFVFEIREVEREHRTKILCYDTALVQHSLQNPMRMHFGMYMREAGLHG